MYSDSAWLFFRLLPEKATTAVPLPRQGYSIPLRTCARQVFAGRVPRPLSVQNPTVAASRTSRKKSIRLRFVFSYELILKTTCIPNTGVLFYRFFSSRIRGSLMTEVAAAYVRTSAEKDDAFSLDSQLDAIRGFGLDATLSVPLDCEFRETFTGKLLERPQLNKLRLLLKEGNVSAVIIYATDRLSRKISVADLLLEELFSYGVKLYIVSWGTFVKDTPEDRLRFNFEAAFSDFERRKISERMHRGKKDKLRQGIYLGDGNPPYGYRKVGQKREMHLEIIQDEAEVIRQIYHWYTLEQLTVPEITRRLRGVPTPAESKGVNFPRKLRAAGEWAEGTIYLILRNAAYTGTLNRWGTSITVPAIISPDVYAHARDRMGQPQPFHTPRHKYLMGRRLKCSFCGYSISSHPHGGVGTKPRLDYRCPSWRETLAKQKCNLPHFGVHLVDDAVWEWVRNLMLYPESLRLMLEESQTELGENSHNLKNRLSHIEERLSMEQKRLAVIIREYIDSEARAQDSPPAASVREVYRQAKEQSEQLFSELTQERDTLQAALLASTIDDALIQEVFTFTQASKDDIDNLPFPEQREIIERLDVRGELAFEDGQRVLYILWHTHRFRKVLATH